MRGLLKIGQTSGRLQNRVDQLSAATGVPTPFVVEAYFLSQNPRDEERQLHSDLEGFRTKGKEFFQVPLDKVLGRCQRVLRRDPDYIRKVNGAFREP